MKVNLKKLYINHFYLSKEEIKLLSKILPSDSTDLETLITLTEDILMNRNSFDEKLYFKVKDIRDKLDVELDKYIMLGGEYNIEKRCFYISSQINFFSFSAIENSLLEDIDDFLINLNEQFRDIALSRWGYNHKKESLEQIGERWDITRERIRQIESKINKSFICHLRVHPMVFWQHIREKMSEDLVSLLSRLSTCFESKKEFYEFIELCCEVKSGDLSEIAHPKVNIKVLDMYFANHPSPVSKDVVVNKLVSEYGYSSALAANILRELATNGDIVIRDNFVSPSRLGKRVAVAHALVSHENGLPWKDIARIVNNSGYCKTRLNENRCVNDYLGDSDYIYLSDKGTYRHLKYLDLSQIDINLHMQLLYQYFQKKVDHRYHLNEYYSEMKDKIPYIEYYTLRHIVRTFGVEYGIYFRGKSSVDSLSLDPSAPHVTQYEVILNMLTESKHPLTKHEIASHLKSKSITHAAFYLDKMLENGDVVRIDYSTYTTPEKAFNNVKELPNIISLINTTLTSTDKIIEIDVIRYKVNIDLNLSYSKYFYSALININSKKQGWFKVSNLACRAEIPFRNLLDLMRSIYNPTLTDNENKEKIRDIVLIRDDILDRNYYNLKTEKY